LIVDTPRRLFYSFEEAEEEDRAYYRSLSREQRLNILLQLIEDYYGPSEGLERVHRFVELERS
jgi:hypothetical protein